MSDTGNMSYSVTYMPKLGQWTWHVSNPDWTPRQIESVEYLLKQRLEQMGSVPLNCSEIDISFMGDSAFFGEPHDGLLPPAILARLASR